MPRLRILPLDVVVEAPDGDTIMASANDAGLYWPTTCGGQGICTSCACSIDEGADSLEPMGRSEKRTLSEEMGEARVVAGRLRLACQTRMHGDVTVTKLGVRRAGASLLAID